MNQPRLSTAVIFRDAMRAFLPILKSTWTWLLALEVLGLCESQFFAYVQQIITARGKEDVIGIAIVSLTSLAIEFLLDAAQVLVIASALLSVLAAPTSLRDTFRSSYAQIIIEKIRAASSILLRSVLLVIPGIVEIVRLCLVPYIVAVDPNYASGHVDALDRSRELIKSSWPSVLLISALFALVPALINLSLNSETSFVWEAPVAILTGRLMSFFTTLIFDILMILICREALMAGKTPSSPAESTAALSH
jgi:hypothetical protein